MAKTTITGLVLRDSFLEWVALSAEKGEETARCVLPLELPRPGEDGAAVGRVPLEEQLRAACKGIEEPVTLGVPLSKALVRVIDLPPVDAAEVEGLVALQIEKLAPFPVDRAVFGYERLDDTERTGRLLVAVARESDVLELSETLKSAGVRVDRVDIDTLGLVRLLRADGRLSAAGVRVMFLCTAGRLDLAVFRDGQIAVLRCVGRLGETPAGEVALETSCTMMGLEIERDSEPLAGVSFLHDGSEGAEAFAAALGTALGLDIEVQAAFAGATAGARGIALRRMHDRPIDLRPEAWKARERSVGFKRRLLRISVVAAAVWGLLLCVGELVLWRVRAARDAVMAQVESISDQADEVRLNQRLIRDLNRYSEQDRSVLECLLFIVEYMPVGGVELSMFTFTKGRSVKVGGDAAVAELIYDMKKRIDESGFFSGSVLSPIVVGRGVQRFELEMLFKQEDGA